jgi:cell division protein FtsB
LVGATAVAPKAAASRAKFTGRAAILLLVMLVLAVSYASSARAWLRQHSEINDLNAEITQRQAAVAALQQTTRRWRDPAYVETQARLRFGWVMPGEIGYRVIDSNGHLLSDGANTLSQPVTTGSSGSGAWWQNEWGSVVAAGQDPAAEAAAKQAQRQPAQQIDRNGSTRQHPGRLPTQPPGR